tara:strand:- start:8700 stop:9422 length:723 start_codon:yes stop_codon:yes gene_type:complete
MGAKVLLCLFIVLLVATTVSAGIVISDSLLEGDSSVYAVGEEGYLLTLIIVDTRKKAAMFELNGERSTILKERNEHRFDDGSIIIVKNVFGDRDGKDLVDFYFAGTGRNTIPVKESTIIREPEGQFESKDLCDDDCGDDDPCTDDICLAGRCVYNENKGCAIEGKCIGFGDIKNGQYCAERGVIPLREDGQTCVEQDECKGRSCFEGICQEAKVLPEQKASGQQGVFGRFFSWIAGLLKI